MQVCCFQKGPQQQLQLQVVFPTRAIPNPKTGFWLFFTSRNPDFFQPINQDILKNLELLLHSNISNCEYIEVEEWRV